MKCLLLAVLFSVFALPAMASDKVDCATINLSFSNKAWTVHCYDDSSQRTLAGEAYGELKYSELYATFGAGEIVDAIDESASPSRVYLKRKSVREFIESHFKVKIDNWQSRDDFNGYEVGQFNTDLGSGAQDCIGFADYSRNRLIVGIACSEYQYDKNFDNLQMLGK